jgi:hypothetical protein
MRPVGLRPCGRPRLTRRWGATRVAMLATVMLVVVCLPAGCRSTPPQSAAAATAGQASAPACAGAAQVYVARRGWHVDIGFAAKDLAAPMSELLAQRFPDVQYIFFGFGDRHYLEANRHTMPVMLAALWPGAGIILATGLRATPEQAFGPTHVIKLSVTSAQLEAAQTFVRQALQPMEDTGELPVYALGPYDGSLYLSASERYSALHTCNTWAAEALQAAQLPIRSRGVVLAGQVWSRVQALAQSQAARSAAGASRPQCPTAGKPTVNGRAASFHPGIPRWFRSPSVPQPLYSSPAAQGYCC